MRRSTEGGEAPGWQGATTENIGNMGGRSNAARRDASPAECRRIYEMSSTSGEWRPTSRRAKREAGNDTLVTHEEVRPKLLRQGQGFGAQAPDPLKAGTLLLRLLRFLRERPVVLLDRLAEPFRHLIGSRQRQRLVARLGVPPQHELELLQLVDRRRLKLLKSARVGVHLIGVELPELPEHFIQIARLDAGGLQLTPQRLGIVRPLAELAAPLADVVRVPAA